jgi:hypothetical protein
MSGNLAVTKYSSPDGKITKLTLDWTSTSGGAVSKAIGASLGDVRALRGCLARAETIPGALGDVSHADSLPTDQYDITLLTPYGADLVDGALANRSGTAADGVLLFSAYIPNIDEITFTVANAGNALSGRCILYFVL